LKYKTGLFQSFITILVTSTILFARDISQSIKKLVINDNTEQIQVLHDQYNVILKNQDSIYNILVRNNEIHNGMLKELRKTNQQMNILKESVSKTDSFIIVRFDDVEDAYKNSTSDRTYQIKSYKIKKIK
jgi:hypothetical protein